jgi:hypothetical protein
MINSVIIKQCDLFIKFSQDEIKKRDNYLEKIIINNKDKIVLLGSINVIYKNESYGLLKTPI